MDKKLDTKRLRYFYTIVAQGSFRKAASVLNISQPPLSQRLKELEKVLDTQLIKRDTRNIELTEEGKFVYEKAKQIFELLDAIPKGVNDIKHKIHETFHIGVSPTCISYLMHHISHIQLQFPETYISVITGDSSYLESMLHEQKVDIALLQLPLTIDPVFEVQLLQRSEIVAILPKSYPIAKNVISFEELAQLPLALLKKVSGVGMYDILMQIFQQKSLLPRIVMDSPEVQTILSFISAQPGLASVLPISELPMDANERYRVLHIDKKDFFMQPCLIHLKQKKGTLIVEYLKKLVQEDYHVRTSL